VTVLAAQNVFETHLGTFAVLKLFIVLAQIEVSFSKFWIDTDGLLKLPNSFVVTALIRQ